MSPAPADKMVYKPQDGGWGWMVVVGAHISIGFAYSTPKVLSIFFKEIQEDLGASFSEIALISSIMLAAMYAGGKLIQSLFVPLICPYGIIAVISSIPVNRLTVLELLQSSCFVLLQTLSINVLPPGCFEYRCVLFL